VPPPSLSFQLVEHAEVLPSTPLIPIMKGDEQRSDKHDKQREK
jgi:hypothetical protein